MKGKYTSAFDHWVNTTFMIKHKDFDFVSDEVDIPTKVEFATRGLIEGETRGMTPKEAREAGINVIMDMLPGWILCYDCKYVVSFGGEITEFETDGQNESGEDQAIAHRFLWDSHVRAIYSPLIDSVTQ